jgi:hypothetical protein
MVISAPPPEPPRERRGYHVHDGFYLRIAGGLGLGLGSVSTDSNSSDDFSLGGAGASLNCWVGGTPGGGVALGGMVSYHGIQENDVEVNGDETGESLNSSLVMLGFFADVFPDPQRGLHFGGALGFAGLSTNGHSDALVRPPYHAPDYNGAGFGASAWIGYMGFVGPEWSLGGMLQMTGAFTGKEEDGIQRQGSTGVLSLSLTALYH